MIYFFKITTRNFLRHRFFTFINLIGLTAGLACALFIFLWVQDELNMNKFHEKDDRLFQVMEFQTYSDGKLTTVATPGILSESLKLDIPEIEYSATTSYVEKSLLSFEDKFLKAEGFHVGEDYFNMFTFPLMEGNPDEVLKDKTSIVLSRDLAIKFFGKVQEAVGKVLRYENNRNFTVTGVFENIPQNATERFDFVLPFKDYKTANEWVNYWGNNGPQTYVILKQGASLDLVNQKIRWYVKEKIAKEENTTELFLKRFSEQYLYGNYTNGVPDGGRIDYVRLFSLIALIIMAIACINFMNLSTARASKRAQEVGIRKSLGGDRSTLIRQYIGESIVFSGVAMILAIGIVSAFLPQFNEITDKSIQMTMNIELISISILAVFVTGLLAGSYPAFYLTQFNPAAVLKGEIRNAAGEVWARKGLVIFQFTITIVLIVGVIVIERQTHYANTKNLGFDRDHVVTLNQDGPIEDKSDVFLAEMRKIPGVVNAAATSHTMLGRTRDTNNLQWRDKNPGSSILFENFGVDEAFQETLGIELLTGRWFSETFGSDTTKIVFNETAIKVMGFSPEEAIGENVKLWGKHDLQIIGVVKDFHFESIHAKVDPAFFRMSDTWRLAIRLQTGQELEAMNQIQALYEQFAPGFIFDPKFMDEGYQKLYNGEQRIGTLSSYFAGLAILISCLGLFGLAAFTAERRLKEIGIRKVLGASASQIVIMLSMDFTKQVLIAILFAMPVAYYFMNEWLESFAYTIDLSPWIFASAAILSLLIAWLTVGSHALRAAHINPSQCLKDE